MPDLGPLTWATDRLEDWQREVVDDKVKGHLLREATKGLTAFGRTAPMLGNDPGSLILKAMLPKTEDLMRANTGKNIKGEPLTGKQWVDAAYHNSPWQNFVSGAVLDPTNLIGFGLPGIGAKAAAKVPVIGSGLAKGLQAANVVDQLPGQVTGKAFNLAGQGGRKILGTAADAIGPMIPDNAGTQAIGKAWDKGVHGWREQALFSPAYHAANWVGNIMLAAQAGQWDVAAAAAKAPFTGRSRKVDDALKALGNNRPKLSYPPGSTPPPIDPDAYNPRWGNEMQKLGREPNVNNPLSTASVYRDIPDTTRPLNWTRDKVAGFSEGNKRFGQNRIEGPGIDAAFQKAFEPKLQENAARFEQQLLGVTDNAGNPHPLAQQAAQALRDSKGLMSPDDLREILIPGSRGRRVARATSPAMTNKIGGGMPQGVSGRVPDWREGLIGQWEDEVIDAVQAGTKNSTDIFFDYTANNPIDKLGQNLFAFHRFPLNNLMKSIPAAGKNPVLANVPVEYYRASDEYNQDRGLPRAFHGRMPLGGQLPGGGQASFDPMQWVPIGGLVKNATRPASTVDDQGTFMGDIAEDLRGVGLGLNPLIDAALTVTGQHGRSFAPSFLRASQPVNGILSSVMDRPVDIEGFPKEILGNAQEQLTGQRPFPYQEYLLNKRQAELKALGKDPKLAGSQLGDTMAIEGVGGFAGVPSLKLLSPEEQTLRSNAALAKAYKLAGNTTASRANPTSRAYADLDPRDAMVANWKSLSAADRRRLLRDPEVRDELLDKLAMQLHNTGDSNARAQSPWLSKSAGAAGPSKRYTPVTRWDLGDPRKKQ